MTNSDLVKRITSARDYRDAITEYMTSNGFREAGTLNDVAKGVLSPTIGLFIVSGIRDADPRLHQVLSCKYETEKRDVVIAKLLSAEPGLVPIHGVRRVWTPEK